MELRAQKCSGCDRPFVGGAACPSCGRRDGLSGALLSGRGTLYSFSRVHVPTPRFQDRTPYLLSLVDLAEGGRVTCQIQTDAPDRLAVGQAVAYDHEEGGVLYFRP